MTAAEDNKTTIAVSSLARWATVAPFLIIGLTFSSYYVRMPSLQLKFGLSDGQLGLFLMLPVLSGLLAMQLAGTLVARFGSAVIVRVAMVAMPVTLVLLAFAEDLVQFGVALLVFGALDGLIDVSMNAHAVTVERTLGRSIMNSCHAGWSVGAMLGSGVGGLLIGAGLSLGQHYVLISSVLVVLGLIAAPRLLPAALDKAGRRPAGDGAKPSWRAGWTSSVLVLGLTGTVVLVVEGAVGNWSGILLHDDLGASLAAASLGYICFNVCQAGGRVIGDRLKDRLGGRTLARCGGAVGVVGLALVVLVPASPVAIAGFGLIGLGLSVLVPIIFSAVGHGSDTGPGGVAGALAKVNTLTYSGQLVGPVVIGWFAQGFGLTSTLGGLLVLLAVALTLGLRSV